MKETAVADIVSIFGDGPLASGFWKTTSCLESIELHQAFYYDDYSFLEKFGSRSAALMFASSEVAGARRDTTGSGLTCRGMMTGSLTRDLETGDMRLSAIYYDRYGNITQTVFENNAGGVSVITNTHDFLGNVLTEKESHSLADGTESLLSRIHKYDRAGRLVQTATDLDGTDVVTRNTYDPVGRLKMTVVTSGEVSDTTLRSYNVRGWQTEIQNDSWSSVMRYQNPEFDESDASFTGNISEWEWTRGNTTDAYSLEYDALSRIVDSRLFRNGNLVDALSESGISYDSNGNILSLTRTGEDGSAVNDLTYHYDGNRLECLVDNGELSGNYAYDADGNMTFDGRTGMSLTWNDLGLVEKVSLDGEDLVNYSYLADGTKVSALNSDGDGLLYLGSLIYKKQGESISLESAGFAGGRFVARETSPGVSSMVPMIHVTDHLGSVRAVVDGISGEVVEINDYYPFGSRWDVATSLRDDSNRFRYNSKEEQFRFGTPYIDYGARQYDPVLGRWFAQDPLSEKYYGISPYAFCNNNSANLVDPDGMASGDPVREPDIRRNKASNLMGEGIRNYNGKYTNHQGFDYYAEIGTDVLSVLDGVVFAVVEDNGAYGTTLTIEHTDQQNNTVYSFYAHLDNVNVNIGENVTEGQVVAKSGISGNAKGLQGLDQHLHFELRSLPENIKGLTGKLDPNTVVDTKFISQDPEVRPQTQVGIIKIYKDGTEEYKDVIR